MIISINILVGSYFYFEIAALEKQNNLLMSSNKNLQNNISLLESKLLNKNENDFNKTLYITNNTNNNKLKSNDIKDLIERTSTEHEIPKFLIPNDIENLADEKLEKYLSNFIKFETKDLPRNMELKSFINTMAKIALTTNISNDDSIEIDSNPRDLKLVFPITDENGKINKKFLENDSNNTKKSQQLIIDINLIGYDDDRVLLKWINTNNGNILRYQYYDVTPNSFNLITFKDINSLGVGNYSIEIYTTKDTIKQIGKFDFFVE